MLQNDQIFWQPGEKEDPVTLSWGNSRGDFDALWEHSQKRWQYILQSLQEIGVESPRGKILEFGSGMGLLDDLLDQECSSLLMLDHTDAYIKFRPNRLSPRCKHVLWNAYNFEQLSPEHGTFDWFISIGVFYHVDDLTAIALISQLGKLLKPGGYVLIFGWNPAKIQTFRERASVNRLFSRYPWYCLNADLMKEALHPDYHELSRGEMLLYRKARP